MKSRLHLILLVVAAVSATMTPAQAQSDAAADAAKEPGAVVTSSGLVYRALKEGAGASPSATDVVKVHYRGTFPDGKEFDSSLARGSPAEFALNGVIKCQEPVGLWVGPAPGRIAAPI